MDGVKRRKRFYGLKIETKLEKKIYTVSEKGSGCLKKERIKSKE